MASDRFDLADAERVLVNALAVRGGADKIHMFDPVVASFRGTLNEVKRLHKSNAAILSDAVRELSEKIVADLNDALVKHGDLQTAVQSFRDENFRLASHPDGKYRWTVREDSNLHEAVEKLSAAVYRTRRRQ